jgi:cell division initiation protein
VKYTPLDLRHQEFSGNMGGYKRLDVRTFLNDVADDLEELLQARQELNERLIAQEGRLAEYRQSEDDLRRAVVSAERIAQELRENARREAELISAQAEAYRDGVTQQANARSVALEARHEARTGELETLHRARATELEAAHQGRSTQLEASYRARFSDLEAQYHRRHRELEQGLSARTTHMESAFSVRHNELSSLLSRARDEQAQFVAQYRALVASFYELSSRHPLPEPTPLPTELPPTSDTGGQYAREGAVMSGPGVSDPGMSGSPVSATEPGISRTELQPVPQTADPEAVGSLEEQQFV